MGYDLVVKGGTIVDGSGRPRFRGDVGVRKGRIVAVGRIREQGAREIDADGHFVAPGFIDGHTHLDAQVTWDPLGVSGSSHGVTSVVMGNCSFSVAPCRESEKELVLKTFERAEDMPREVLEQIEWRWETFAEYLENLERLPKGINFGALVGHSALRTYVMGERAFEKQATEDEVAAMRAELRSAMDAGALGFSSSRSRHHWTTDNLPVGSRQASYEELMDLVDVLDEVGAGTVEFITGRSFVSTERSPEEAARINARLLEMALRSGRTIIDLSGTERPDYDPLSYWESAASQGARLIGGVRCKPFSSYLGFRVKLPFDTLPGWAEVRKLPIAEQQQIFADPERRAALVHEAMTKKSGSEIGAEARPPAYDRMYIIDGTLRPSTTVAAAALQRGTTPVDVMVDLALDSDFQQLFAQFVAADDFDSMREMLAHPLTITTGSDTGAHVAQVVDSDFPTFLLGYWVRDQKAFTWEQAVRMLTFDAAQVWGVPNRGLITEGAAADLAIFDPKTVQGAVPVTVNDLPGGKPRLTQAPIGVLSTVVNGVEVYRDGQPTGNLPGSVIRNAVARR